MERLVKLHAKAKFDSATAEIIELLPRDVKVVSMKKINIMDE